MVWRKVRSIPHACVVEKSEIYPRVKSESWEKALSSSHLQHAEVADGSLDNENLSILLRKNPVTADDFYQAIASMNHSTSTELCERLKKWSNSHGISYQA